MAAKLPVRGSETDTCSVMAYGFDPHYSAEDPFGAAYCAVVTSVAKLVAAGASTENCWLTFQEYFEKLGSDPVRWGKPLAALLGALRAQLGLRLAAIGGKDSLFRLQLQRIRQRISSLRNLKSPAQGLFSCRRNRTKTVFPQRTLFARILRLQRA